MGLQNMTWAKQLGLKKRLAGGVYLSAFLLLAAAGLSPGAHADPAPASAPDATSAPAATQEAPTSQEAPTTAPTDADGNPHPVSKFKINYEPTSPPPVFYGLPLIKELENMELQLGKTDQGYVSRFSKDSRNRDVARPNLPIVTLKLKDIGGGKTEVFYGSAIRDIDSQIVNYFNTRLHLVGIYVEPDTNQLDGDDDRRASDATGLTILVHLAFVDNVRAIGTGDRFPEEKRIRDPRNDKTNNANPSLDVILEHAPVHASSPDHSPDLLRKDELDDYLFLLNRHAGRRVDVAVSGSDKPGGVDVDFLVNEQKPWYVYAQGSNTGTSQTNNWRERFGFIDNQLSGHDDTLSLDYVTAGFNASHDLNLSYEAPVGDCQRLRYRVYAGYEQFTASDVGLASETFQGTEYKFGGEGILNFYQDGPLFIDALAGIKYDNVEVFQELLNQDSHGYYVVPYFGLKADRYTEAAKSSAELTMNIAANGSSEAILQGLGRTDPTRLPYYLQFGLSHSFYLEPLIDPVAYAEQRTSLAHEIVLSVRGQYAFDNRLIAQFEDVVGGLYTVRGYPEAFIAADSTLVGTAEYRFHFPRIFTPNPVPSGAFFDRGFRSVPSSDAPAGTPDWDLILRAFVDVGGILNSHAQSFENNGVMVSTGVGAELQFYSNVSLRVDWGVALASMQALSDNVHSGDNRFHFVFTVSY